MRTSPCGSEVRRQARSSGSPASLRSLCRSRSAFFRFHLGDAPAVAGAAGSRAKPPAAGWSLKLSSRHADTSLDEKLHFSDSVLAGSVTHADRGYHLSRLTGDTSWAKGFEVGKGQSGQDALRHVMHISAYARAFSKEKATPHGDFYHVVHPSSKSPSQSHQLLCDS